jgi:hypothetical protein
MRIIIASLFLLLTLAGVAHSRQYVVQQQGQLRVVHTRRAPVIFHRVLPPYTGIHIHESELRSR